MFSRSRTGGHVLTHPALLKPALQASCGHRGPRAVFGAWCGFRGVVRFSERGAGLRASFCWFGLPAFAIQA